jgi:hypothetical protein
MTPLGPCPPTRRCCSCDELRCGQGALPVLGSDPCLASLAAGGVTLAIKAIGSTYAASVCSARHPVVAFGEDHGFPERSWAQALLEAYGDFGPAVRNANPGNAASWADLLIAYAPGCSRPLKASSPFSGQDSRIARGSSRLQGASGRAAGPRNTCVVGAATAIVAPAVAALCRDRPQQFRPTVFLATTGSISEKIFPAIIRWLEFLSSLYERPRGLPTNDPFLEYLHRALAR